MVMRDFQTTQWQLIASRKACGEICESAQRPHPPLRYFVHAASQQQGAFPSWIALQDRHDKNKALEVGQFGHGIDFAFSLCLVLPCAPEIALVAVSSRRGRNTFDCVLDQPALHPGSSAFPKPVGSLKISPMVETKHCSDSS